MNYKLIKRRVLCLVIGFSAPLIAAEIILRFLPVASGGRTVHLNEIEPILSYQPNQEIYSSKDWNFKNPILHKINNDGFFSSVDYDSSLSTPLMAVIGDSYVEAIHVPHSESITGKLRHKLPKSRRIYSFGRSMAPMSQYLSWAQYAYQKYGAERFVFVIVGNDFKESMREYSSTIGFQYQRDSSGNLNLTRFDYSVPFTKRVLRESALIRYLYYNLRIREKLHYLFRNDNALYEGNVEANFSSKEISDSNELIDKFLDDLLKMVPLPTERFVFVIDAVRPSLYDLSNENIHEESYFGLIRKSFIDKAIALDFKVVDLHPIFRDHYSNNKKRFEFEEDAHWNSLGHKIASQAVVDSQVFIDFSN